MKTGLLGIALAMTLTGCAGLHAGSPSTAQPITLLAHRALGQDYSRERLERDTCTAALLVDTGHRWLENTLPAMEAAFEAGADIVEFDIHPTTDSAFAVFHDWTLDCRTNGSGVTRQHTLAQLKALDVGYGYTADGRLFPFRGQGIGMMPSLDEVLARFPGKRFLINIKSRDPAEGALLAERLAQLPSARRELLMAYGADAPMQALRERLPDFRVMSRSTSRDCLLGYLVLGWLGHVPVACERTLVIVPLNLVPWLAGFPERFVARMRAAGSDVFLINDYSGEGYTRGLDTLADLGRVPANYRGGIWTDRADVLGPAIKAAGRK